MSLAAALLLAGAQPALAKDGDCGWVHGRYAVYNGSSVHRIWMIGTHRMLSLDMDQEDIPAQFLPLYKSKEFEPVGNAILGDFYVCASGRRIAGRMQKVKLKRARNLRVVDYQAP
jgi:hypothetical protein